MLNYVALDFPLGTNPPQRITQFSLTQERYAHEMITVQFRDWDIQYSNIKPGNPVNCTLRGTDTSREIYGYIHDIRPHITPGARTTEMTIIGASYQLKQANQRVFSNVTATDVIKKIASEHSFSTELDEHPRVYDQVVQPGTTDLQLMTRLAKQCGYTLRIENTAIHFKNLITDFNKYKSNAPHFTMRNANDPQGSTLYSFDLLVSESYKYLDSYKSAIQIGGVDPNSISGAIATNQTRPKTIRTKSEIELFDSYATETVAPSSTIAYYEALSADELNRFPYRARITVLGYPTINPDKPIYLDGLGPDYSGYWIVLSSIHSVIETSPNVFQYTTTLMIGADSLGTARTFNKHDVTKPSPTRIRQITVGKRNVAVKHKTKLVRGTGTTSNTGLSRVTNRATNTRNSNSTPYTYRAGNG
jgi:phage protein D